MLKLHIRMLRPLARSWFVRTLIPAVGDFAILLASLVASIAMRSNPLSRAGLVYSFIPLFAVFLGVFSAAGLYDLRRVRDFVSLIGGLLVSAAVCVVVGTMYFYVFTNY